MNLNTKALDQPLQIQEDPIFEGMYGTFRITTADEIEVQRYRVSLLISGISLFIGLNQWILFGPTTAWVWFFPLAIGLGLALNWVHIYLRPLHRTLKIFWLLGCLGLALIAFFKGPTSILTSLSEERVWILAIGPLFAALTGLGFKEFFCFRRPEAIGLTLLVPIALIGHLVGILNPLFVLTLMNTSGLLLLILAVRKFGMDAADDVGDKSVFEYLDKNITAAK